MSSSVVSEPAALLNVRQVAAMLGCSSRHVYRLADRGAMPRPTKLGDVLVRWRRSEIERWLNEGCPRMRAGSAKGVRQ